MPDPAVMKDVVRHLRRTERRRLYDLLGDGELLARFLADRDETAFEELVCRHGPMVRAVCRRVLGPTADADDAFQAAFLVLLRKARSIRRTDLLANWLCAVAYRTARQALRRRYRLGARERTWDDLPEPHRPDDPPRDWLPLFDAALQRLPSKYRDPVVLCELQGLARPEAAKRLGLNEGTLSSRLGRARDLLRRRLSPYGFPMAVGSALAPALVPEALTAATAAAAVSVSAASVSAVVLTEGVLTAMFASKLKAGAACTAVLFVGTVAGLQYSGPASGAGGPPSKEPSPPTVSAIVSPTLAPAERDPKPDGLPGEYDPFQGEWVVTAAEKDGTAQRPHAIGVDENWTFARSKLTTGGDAKSDATETFTLDPKAKPPAIDFTLTQFSPDGTGALVRTAYRGIYRFEPDGRLVICYRKSADNILRPTRFATAQNSGAVVVGLRRPEGEPPPARAVEIGVPDGGIVRIEPPALKPDPAKDADLGKVVGAWELTDVDGLTPDGAAKKLDQEAGVGTLRREGNPGSRMPRRWEALRRLYLLPAGGPVGLVPDAAGGVRLAFVELDGSRSPRWLTLQTPEFPAKDVPALAPPTRVIRLCGIYNLDGDKLTLCLPESEASPLLRPTEFKGDGEGGLYVLTYKRPAMPWTPVAPPPAAAAPTSLPAPPHLDPKPAIHPDPFGLPKPPPDADRSTIPTVSPPTAPINVPIPVTEARPPAPRTDDVPVTNPTIPAADLPVLVDPAAPQRIPTITASQTDLDQLQGIWVAVTLDGKPFASANDDPMSIEILKDRILASDGRHGRLRLDDGMSPRRIAFEMPGPPEKRLSGIYKIEGDRLTIASHSRSAKLLPVGFEPDSEAGIAVIVYERAKGDRPLPKNTEAGVIGSINLSPARRPSDNQGRPPLPAPMPTNAAPGEDPAVRDLRKEVEQLREQLKRMENELKDRKPEPPATAN